MCDSSAEKIFEAQKSSSFGIFQSILTETDLWMNRLHKKGIFTLLRFLNEYNLSLVLILNREITDGEPGNNSYEILKFWPILSLAILIKRILIKKRCNHSFCFRHWVKVIVHIQNFDLNANDIMYSIWYVRCPWMAKSSCTIKAF